METMKSPSNSPKKQSKSHFYHLAVFCRGKKVGGGDILCEMRFHVLNNELDAWEAERDQAKKDKKKVKDEETKDAKGSDNESDEEADSMTPAKLFNQKIIAVSEGGTFSRTVILVGTPSITTSFSTSCS